MKLPEIWENFSKGEWISRKAWKKDYAIALCNLKSHQGLPVLMHDTYGYMYHFGSNQSPRILRKMPEEVWLRGHQYDLLADDWFVADQTQCDITLGKSEVSEVVRDGSRY